MAPPPATTTAITINIPALCAAATNCRRASPRSSSFSADNRSHDLDTDFSGYQRDSRGLTGNVGTSFELPGRLTGEVSAGYTRRNYADPRFEPLTGLIGDASLIWTADALTTVKLTATSTVGEFDRPRRVRHFLSQTPACRSITPSGAG